MTITWITAIGMVAAICTTASFLPQVVKTWRTKSAGDLSLVMYAILCTGVFLWGVYGLLIGDLPILLANGVTLLLAGSILFFIVRDRIQRKNGSKAGDEGQQLQRPGPISDAPPHISRTPVVLRIPFPTQSQVRSGGVPADGRDIRQIAAIRVPLFSPRDADSTRSIDDQLPLPISLQQGTVPQPNDHRSPASPAWQQVRSTEICRTAQSFPGAWS